MRKAILFLLTLVAFYNASGQISSRTAAEQAVSKPRAYDSLSAFNPKEDLRIYIGQTLFFLPKSKKRAGYSEKSVIGYDDFSNSAKSAGNLKENQYHPVQGSNKYDFKSDYSKIAGKYFVVAGFIDKTDKKYSFKEQGLYFKLYNKELKDTAYYMIAQAKEHLSDRMIVPFVVLGHFEKLKKETVGQKLQLQKDVTLKDINNGQPVLAKKDSWWECVDFSIVDFENEIYSSPVFVFRNEKSEEIAVNAPGYSGADIDTKSFMTPKELEIQKLKKAELEALQKKEAEEKAKREAEAVAAEKKFRQDCIAKYGANYGNNIANGKVVIGMTKEMCELAWGEPMYINTLTTGSGKREQWVYSLLTYLYFEKGQLVAIQN